MRQKQVPAEMRGHRGGLSPGPWKEAAPKGYGQKGSKRGGHRPFCGGTVRFAGVPSVLTKWTVPRGGFPFKSCFPGRVPGSSCGQLPADAAEESTEGQEKEPYIVGSPRAPSGGAPADPTESRRTGAPTSRGNRPIYSGGAAGAGISHFTHCMPPGGAGPPKVLGFLFGLPFLHLRRVAPQWRFVTPQDNRSLMSSGRWSG